MRAKLEHALCLTEPLSVSNVKQDPDVKPGPEWVIKDPLVPPRHLKSREGFKTTKEWIKENKRRGYNKWLKMLFRAGELVGLFLLGIIVFRMSNSLCLSLFVSSFIFILILIINLCFKDNFYEDC